jgi:twinkle protein
MMNPTVDNPSLLRGRHTCDNCGSSDSLGYYEDHTHCFGACNKTWFYEDTERSMSNNKVEDIDFNDIIETLDQISSLPMRGVKERNLTRDVMEFYGVHSEVNEDGTFGTRYYPWHVDGKLVAYKGRTLDKKWFMKGDTQCMKRQGCGLFGQHLFSGGGRMLIITEGLDDAIAVQRAYAEKYKGKRYPVVSLFNSNGEAQVVNNLEWVNSFDSVILWPDKDPAGEAVMDNIAKLCTPGKVKIVDSGDCKDANEVLVKSGVQALTNLIWNAVSYSPAGFVRGEAIWDAFKTRENVAVLPYPDCIGGLNKKLKGMRKGEITLFVSGTGLGKTTITKEAMMKIIAEPNEKLGIISLEEDVGETAQKFIEMELGKDVMDEDNPVPEEEKYAAYTKLFGDENVIILDHQGSVSDQSLISKMRALCAMGCGYIVLDHITIAVSEGNEGLTGNEAIDKMMSDLLKLVKSFPVWLGVISHLRKTGAGAKPFEEGHMPSLDDIKGSGSIKQISFDIIAFSRNTVAENEREKNTISMRILKARFTGQTGDCGKSYYNHATRRLEYIPWNSVESAGNMFKDIDKEPDFKKPDIKKSPSLEEQMGL